jgi:hypothetical protein
MKSLFSIPATHRRAAISLVLPSAKVALTGFPGSEGLAASVVDLSVVPTLGPAVTEPFVGYPETGPETALWGNKSRLVAQHLLTIAAATPA